MCMVYIYVRMYVFTLDGWMDVCTHMYLKVGTDGFASVASPDTHAPVCLSSCLLREQWFTLRLGPGSGEWRRALKLLTHEHTCTDTWTTN